METDPGLSAPVKHQPDFRVRALGPLEVWAEGESLVLGGPRQQMVLALLLVAPNRVVSADRLVDEVWGEEPPGRAVHSLQTYVSNLRRLLGARPSVGDRIETRRPGYLFRVEPEEFDVLEFADLAGRGMGLVSVSPVEAAGVLRRALGLWRGSPFAGLADEVPLLGAEGTRLEELRFAALEARIEADLARGEHDSVVAELEVLTVQHPLRERLWAALMTALYRSGRQSESLRAYQAARKVLGEELGIEPSSELEELEERILQHDSSLEFRSGEPPRGNLPADVTSFVGRTEESGAITGLLEGSRLVTLTGASGVGKTRLALRVADVCREEFSDGAWLVELAPLRNPALVPKQIAATVGVVEQATRPVAETLLASLVDRELLVVLDNCEHLIAGAAAFCEALLKACPGVKVLATSREALSVSGETVWQVRPLSVPVKSGGDPEASESVRLFADRARDAMPSFHMSAEGAATTGEICRRLDGIPLAIELAAAQLRSLSLEQIADRLDDRFRLLGGSRTSVPRHRTLDAAISWSYDLLSHKEQTLFRRLAVFHGSFSLEATAAIALQDSKDNTLALMSRLVEKSLVTRVRETDRYRLLETIREYASIKLVEAGEAEDALAAHTAWFVAHAEDNKRRLHSRDQLEALDLLEAEHDNFRAVLERATERGDYISASRLAGALHYFWWLRSYVEESRRWTVWSSPGIAASTKSNREQSSHNPTATR